MERPGLTDLPEEVIHHISRYLSVQDVLSCSLTCHYLRAALNDNCVWRKYLPQDISALETQEQQVSPRLEMDESLTPLCEKRQQFTRKTHLMNNWLTGNYVQYSSSIYALPISNEERWWLNKLGYLGNAIYKDKYIFLSRDTDAYANCGIEIWDVSKYPVLYTLFETEYLRFYFCIVGSLLITTNCSGVFVHQINLPDKDFPLLYSFLVTDKNVTYNEIVDHGCHNDECDEYSWAHQFVRNYLLSNKAESNRLHIWDIHNASKLGCFEPPICADLIHLHSFLGNTCTFIVKELDISPTKPYYLVTFDLDSKQFSNSTLRFDHKQNVISYKSHIILIKSEYIMSTGFFDVFCTLYDFHTSSELRNIRISNVYKNIVPFAHQTVVKGTFIIAGHEKCYVINALTLEVVDTFNYRQSNNSDLKSVKLFCNIYEDIIAVVISDIWDGRIPHIQLWNVSKKETLIKSLNLEAAKDFYFDSLFTKLVTINKDNTITVVHLW